MIPDSDLAAYADGELRDGARRRRVEAAIAADPAVAARLAEHRRLREAVSGAFAEYAEAPVPPRLAAAARTVRTPAPARPSWMWRLGGGGLVAAGLAAGIAAAWSFSLWKAQMPGAGQGPRATGDLARALDGQLSGEPGATEVRFSFRTRDGRACRAFTADGGAWAGLACREGPDWRMMARAPTAPDATEDYRPAGSGIPAVVLETSDALRAGDALDRDQEAKARDGGWAATRP